MPVPSDQTGNLPIEKRLLHLLNYFCPQMQRNTDEGGCLLESPSGMQPQEGSFAVVVVSWYSGSMVEQLC